jgi:cobalt-zinc-cadmium efflux system membrane fusion protein
MVATIVDLGEAWFLARVFEHHVGQVAVGAAAEITLNAYPDQRFGGTVINLAHQVDPATRTLTARVKLENRDGLLRLGLFGAASIAVAPEEALPPDAAPPLVVPRSAVTEIHGKPVVFVRHADDDFELHEVVLGASAPGKVVVLHGLREGERVVTHGVFTLKSVLLRDTFAEDHH